VIDKEIIFEEIEIEEAHLVIVGIVIVIMIVMIQKIDEEGIKVNKEVETETIEEDVQILEAKREKIQEIDQNKDLRKTRIQRRNIIETTLEIVIAKSINIAIEMLKLINIK
jgi:hypothetical protein